MAGTQEMERIQVREAMASSRLARRTSPRSRPPLGARVVVGMIGLGAMVFTVALMLSDRAPGALRTMFGERVRRLWDRIDASERARFATDAELPQTDFIVHVAIWAVVAALIGLAIWTWRGLVLGALTVFVCSIVIELAQGRYSDTRVVEIQDVQANALGIAIGTTTAAVAYAIWSSMAALIGAVRRH